MARTVHPTPGTEIQSDEMAEHLSKILSMVDRVESGYTITGTNLTPTLEEGKAYIAGFEVGETGETDTLNLADNDTNHVYVDETGAITVNQTGTAPAGVASLKLWEIDTSGGSITDTRDQRFFIARLGAEFQADSVEAVGSDKFLRGFRSHVVGDEPYADFEDETVGSETITRIKATAGKLELFDVDPNTQAETDLNIDLRNVAVGNFIPTSEKGAANGVATLDGSGVHPASEYRLATETTKGGVQLASAAATALGAAAKGTSSRAARQDHVHAHGDLSLDGGTHHAFDQVTGIITDGQHGNRGGGSLHANATTGAAGFMSATDKTKLNGIESGATADQTATEIRDLLITVDGAGSGVDADLLDGEEGSFYRNASNINAGTLADARLPSSQAGKTFTSDVTLNTAANPDADLGASLGTALLRFADIYGQNVHTGDLWLSDEHCSRTGQLIEAGDRIAFDVMEVTTKGGMRELRTVPYIIEPWWKRVARHLRRIFS